MQLQTKNEQNPVMIIADATVSIIRVSENNPEYGHIRVEQKRIVIDTNNFARPKVLSALIHGTVADLKSFGWNKDTKLEGKIVVVKSLEPFNAKNPERDYLIAGTSGVVCCIDGQPIYSKNVFTYDVNQLDTPLMHNNKTDIQAAYAAAKAQTEAIQDVDAESIESNSVGNL